MCTRHLRAIVPSKPVHLSCLHASPVFLKYPPPSQMFQRIAQCAGATAATVAGCAALSSQVYNTKALEIKQRGYTTLPLFLSEDERQVLLRHTRRQPLLNPTEIAGLPPCAEPTKGRFHCELTNTFHRYWSRSDDLAVSDIKSTVLAVESRAKQFAHVFFNPPLPGVSGVAGVAGVATKNIRFRMTQLQLLDSKAQSQVQFWHVDNTSRGLTFVVALEDIHEEHGPTELMTSTQTMHAPTDGEFQINHCCTTVTQALACTRGSSDGHQGEDQPLKIVRVQKATLAKKEAFVFDSRTWHRGGANMSDTSRPVLIIRYDLSDCTPPGMGVVGTSLIRFVGWLIEDAVAREHGK